jgi:hypothetical protein
LEFAPDGVGDACDPHPELGGDRIILFDPFTSLSTAWEGDTQDFVIVGDELVHADTVSGADVLLRTDLGDINDVVLETTFTITSSGSGCGSNNVGVAAAMDLDELDGRACTGDDDGDELLFLDINDSQGVAILVQELPVDLVSRRTRVVFEIFGFDSRCKIPDLGAELFRDGLFDLTGLVGVRANCVEAELESFVVYTNVD